MTLQLRAKSGECVKQAINARCGCSSAGECMTAQWSETDEEVKHFSNENYSNEDRNAAGVK
jgi:hypothetical protein